MDLPRILVRFTARSGCLIFPKVSLDFDAHSSSYSVGKVGGGASSGVMLPLYDPGH